MERRQASMYGSSLYEGMAIVTYGRALMARHLNAGQAVLPANSLVSRSPGSGPRRALRARRARAERAVRRDGDSGGLEGAAHVLARGSERRVAPRRCDDVEPAHEPARDHQREGAREAARVVERAQ